MQKIDSYDNEGNLIESIDTRTLEFTKEQRISYVKQQCTAYILENFPDYKQRNAGMGIYSVEENNRIIDGVREAIAKCDTIESLINSCQTNDEVDVLDWNNYMIEPTPVIEPVPATDPAPVIESIPAVDPAPESQI